MGDEEEDLKEVGIVPDILGVLLKAFILVFFPFDE